MVLYGAWCCTSRGGVRCGCAEASLNNVDKVLRGLRMKSRRLEGEIREIVRSQTDAGEQGKRELEEARRAIHELFTKIEHIKTKAEQSEEMVKEITSGIKSLDYAKRHLTVSITTLRRLNMLGTVLFPRRSSLLTPRSLCPRSSAHVLRNRFSGAQSRRWTSSSR